MEKVKEQNPPESISYPEWYVPGGGMMYRRDALPFDHPEHLYNYVKREYGVDPEDYNIYPPPHAHTCPNCKHVFVANHQHPGQEEEH